MNDVLYKQQNYGLWRSGAYGTKLRAWETLDAYYASDFGGLVALRSRAGGGGSFCIYDLDPLDVPRAELTLLRGHSRSAIMVNEMAPSDSIVMQGEYHNDVFSGYDYNPQSGFLHYSREQLHMRDALRTNPAVALGLRADLLIAQSLSPGSLDDWCELKERFPGHTIEFTVYDRFVGDVPHRNTLVWEVRKY